MMSTWKKKRFINAFDGRARRGGRLLAPRRATWVRGRAWIIEGNDDGIAGSQMFRQELLLVMFCIPDRKVAGFIYRHVDGDHVGLGTVASS